MGKMQQFKREIRASNGRMFAFEAKHGFGAVLGGLFEKVARGRVKDREIREIYGVEDDEGGPQPHRVRIEEAAGPMLMPSQKPGKYTALVSMHGVALYDLEFQPYCFSTLLLSQICEQLANDASVDTVVVDINTPGGHVTGTQEAADAMYKLSRKKNVIGIINPLCASAGYWIGSQCSKLIAVPSADVGSIGVFMLHVDCSKFMSDMGLKGTFIYAGEHKTEGNSLEPLSEEALKFYQSEVDQTYDDFLTAVARGRGVSKEVVFDKFGKGRCYTAQVAKRVGMVDEIATIKMALHSVGLTMEMTQQGGRRRGEVDQPAESAEAPPVAEPAATTEDAKAITFRQDRGADGSVKTYVLAAWPTKTVIGAALILVNSDPVRVAGDTITIAVENGAAVYTKTGTVAGADDWICALVEGSSFSEPPAAPEPPAAEEDTSAPREAEARQRRLALLSA